MVPKVDGVADVERAAAAIDAASRPARAIPLHVLVETHGALREVAAIAAHPRVESISFGLMDFVSAHRGAIPASAMSAEGQFAHPLVVRAKLEIAAACHGLRQDAVAQRRHRAERHGGRRRGGARASRELGYTRMWSIHPGQIRPIVAAFAPEPRRSTRRSPSSPPRRTPTGRRSATPASCTTGPATATTGACWPAPAHRTAARRGRRASSRRDGSPEPRARDAVPAQAVTAGKAPSPRRR